MPFVNMGSKSNKFGDVGVCVCLCPWDEFITRPKRQESNTNTTAL